MAMMIDDALVAKLIAKGGKRWTKGKYDRIYFGATKLGLEVEYYNTGNVRRGYFNGEPMLSNSETRRYLSAENYINVNTGETAWARLSQSWWTLPRPNSRSI